MNPISATTARTRAAVTMGTLMGTAVGLELGPIVMLGTSVEAKNKQTKKKKRRRTVNN